MCRYRTIIVLFRQGSESYTRFDDKAELLLALAVQTLTEFGTRTRSASEHRDRYSLLHRGCTAYLHRALEQPHHYQLIFGDTPVAQPGQELESAAGDATPALRELVERARAEGELGAGPPRELATILSVLLHGLGQLQVTRHLHEPRTIDGDTWLDELLALALAALRPAQHPS